MRVPGYSAALYLFLLIAAEIPQAQTPFTAPGAAPQPPALTDRLQAALAAKDPGYSPRTEHLLPNGRPKYSNRLILEDSPYLLQHAHNPVDWYAWGGEAFDKAKRENKLIFLSIGYSTCHWCHVMERESFENLEVARLLNQHFVAIKVDRERRPDVDHTYMTAVHLLTGHGGWPMSSILTPDGKTIIGGTYFPPRIFARWLAQAQALWQERPAVLRAQAERVARAVQSALAADEGAAELGEPVIARAVAQLLEQYDDLQGGFGPAPKFPQEPRLFLLLDQALRTGDGETLAAATFTLRALAGGGIHDQVGGGFHRYATDNDWLVPHFEKMLYNQAALARLYLAAYRLTADDGFARVARRTLDFVLRDMTSPEGGFYSATDADSEGEEGRFYLWTRGEIEAVLSPEDAKLALAFYGVTEAGNLEGRNILHLSTPPPAFAAARGLSTEHLWQRVERINQALYRAREHRPHPHRDEKILTVWNGMMITALAEAADPLHTTRYLTASERAADLLWSKIRRGPGDYRRVYMGNKASLPALQEDHAYLAEALLTLYDATAEPRWLERAREVADAMLKRFWDPTGGGFFMGEFVDDTPLMARPKDVSCSARPSGNAVALRVLAGLANRTGEELYRNKANALLAAFSGEVQRRPWGFPYLLIGLSELRRGDSGTRHYAARGVVRAKLRITGAGPQRATLAVDLELRPGWHVNAHRPLQDYLTPTAIRLAGDHLPWKLDSTVYPPPEIVTLRFQHEPLAVYQGKVRIEAGLERVLDDIRGPSMIVPVEIRLQACSEEVCLPPETLVLKVPFKAG